MCYFTVAMKDQQWYESLSENYREKYDKEVFTQETIGVRTFLE